MKYPIYKKGAVTWHKINSDRFAVTVILMPSVTKIRLAENKDIVEDIMQDEYMVDCTRDEFEKAYGEAQWKLTQANILQ